MPFKGDWWNYAGGIKGAVNDLINDHPVALRIPRAPSTVAALPAPTPANAGTRGFVSDSTVDTFGTTVVGGGAIKVPVFSDGIAWKVG